MSTVRRDRGKSNSINEIRCVIDIITITDMDAGGMPSEKKP
jgi:hypothetical protein